MDGKAVTLLVEGVSDEPDYPLTVLANMLGDAARRLEMLEENMTFPATIVVEREHGRLKLSAVQHPDHEAALNTASASGPNNGEWTVGYYVPTAAFKAIPEHTAVMDVATQELVAITGPAGDPASEADARLFAAARTMQSALEAVSNQLAAWSMNGGVLAHKNVSDVVFEQMRRLELVLEAALVAATGD